MLYINFEIGDTAKYKDFEKLYAYMVEIRQPDFKFDDTGPEFDWDTIPEDEVENALEELNTYLDQQVEPEVYRCKEKLPEYVREFLKHYLQHTSESPEYISDRDVVSIFNYLEFDFEVAMENLLTTDEYSGVVQFSTGNYPFGGLERFIATMAAYQIKSISCFDGFNHCELHWTSAYDFEFIPKSKNTKRTSKVAKIIKKLFK
ncbi:DUF2764 family protein [Cochleicola gelatinilyticus]|uniref:Uncharacterized protein n=1 Tax=Cochleicola gelatinilyticus TaxID=1763537 RepID=A0A167HSM3_9FLAO|nr:DUF2764 family protein [Cochleicola gelatinilyticus]OAB78921.1 hypothetical protein ULVI_10110 [Cochleicola gelatinilyticus]